MALSRTTLLGAVSNGSGSFGTGVFTTSSFTPPDASLLVVGVAAIENGGTDNLVNDLTVSGGGWTYTSRVQAAASTGFGTAARIWTAPVTTGASMTLGLDCAARSAAFYFVSVAAYTGYDTTTPIGATATGFQDTGFGPSPPYPVALTLSGAPATTSEVFGVVGVDRSPATAGITFGSGWTELHDVFNSDWGAAQSQVRGSSTSTSVGWDDVAPTGTGSIFNFAAAALEIREAAGGPTPFSYVGGMVIG